jgi:HAE1 family hydrophobic/amphiphilic exporter-1
MFLSNISIKRPIMVSMFLLAVVMFGVIAFFGLPLNLMPALDIPFVTVQVPYPGAGPLEVETEIIKRVEDEVSTVSGIETLTSYAMENVGITLVEFKLGKDVDVAVQEVKDKVDAIRNDFPADAQLPIVGKIDINAQPIMNVLLAGNQELRELTSLAERRIKDRLSQIPGVAQVQVIGGEAREIRVELDNAIVFQNALSLGQVSRILAAQNVDMPAGQFQQDSQELSVRMEGRFDSVDALRNLEIPTPHGSRRLEQLARVLDSSADVRERTVYFDNRRKTRDENVVLLSITPAPDGNAVEIADGVRRALPSLREQLPAGASLTIVSDDSEFIRSTVNDTLMNVFLGIILTAGVLLFFLHDLRSTLIAALAMPISIISTFVLLQTAGFSKNIMSLMGLSVSVGILITNSVVVLENIFRHRDMGQGRMLAADRGTSEIANAVLASTLTNIAVFLPLAMVSGMVGIFLKEFALTVVFATVFSLIVSFTITPMLASRIIPEHDTKKHPVGRKLEAMFQGWERKYRSALETLFARRRRGAVLLGWVFILFAGSLMLFPGIGFEFAPEMDQGVLNVEVELPQGYNLTQTAGVMAEIERKVQDHPQVECMVTTLGTISELDQGVNMARMDVHLVDADRRSLSDKQLASALIRDLSTVPNARIRVQAVGMGAGGGSYPIEFYLQGQDMDRLEELRERIVGELGGVDGLVNLTTSSRKGKPEVTLYPDRLKMDQAGVNAYDLAMTLRASVEGTVATTYREDGEEYDVRVVLADRSTDTPEKVENLPVVTSGGTYRLAQFTDLGFTEGYSRLLHRDKFRSIQFNGSNAPGFVLGDVVNDIQRTLAGMDLPEGYEITWGGSAQMLQETTRDMGRAFLIAVVITYMLLAAILENLVQPVLILGTVPLALIGVLGALFITGQTMNISSMMAVIMLVGIVVNNAILLLDYTNMLKRGGKSTTDALLEACPVKLKPILMAAITTMLGMLPLALGIGDAGAEMRQPMGIVSIGGLAVSAALTLFVIPTVYNLVSRDRGKEGAQP